MITLTYKNLSFTFRCYATFSQQGDCLQVIQLFCELLFMTELLHLNYASFYRKKMCSTKCDKLVSCDRMHAVHRVR